MKVNAKPFIGQHCEITATGTLLKQIGIDLSEPMLFGLGEGLSFIIWNMKIMDFPFMWDPRESEPVWPRRMYGVLHQSKEIR